MTLSIMTRDAECRVFVVFLSVFVLIVIILIAVMLSVIATQDTESRDSTVILSVLLLSL
jgi:hypothetical protein